MEDADTMDKLSATVVALLARLLQGVLDIGDDDSLAPLPRS
jgi:hypothetical protein